VILTENIVKLRYVFIILLLLKLQSLCHARHEVQEILLGYVPTQTNESREFFGWGSDRVHFGHYLAHRTSAG
jgi:hypothetical protein